jgi:hypothetical protein
MSQWERGVGLNSKGAQQASKGDGEITFDEFLEYYKEISAGIDSDDQFELMIRNAWRIAGGEGACANTANKRVLVTNKDGSQSIATIEQELGMKGGKGEKAMEEVKERLARQGLKDIKDVGFFGGYEDDSGPPKRAGGRPGGAVPGQRSQAQPGGRVATPNSLRGRSVTAVGGGSVKEAWGEPSKQALESPRYVPEGVFDPFDTVRRILYHPPVSLETLCIKLQVSAVNSSPRMAQGAFLKR